MDTGATYYCVPKGLADVLELRLEFKTKVASADRREAEAWYATAYVEIMGRGT